MVYGNEKRGRGVLCVRPGNAGLSLYLAAPAMVNIERAIIFTALSLHLRLKDGGPILVPSTPNYPLRHVYADDVVSAVIRLIETGQSKGAAYNISQDETVPLDEFLALVGDILGVPANVVRVRRDVLEANGFLPDCSPFSDRWMSELDNTRGKAELGITYTRCAPISKRSSLITTKPAANSASYRRRRAEGLLLEYSARWPSRSSTRTVVGARYFVPCVFRCSARRRVAPPPTPRPPPLPLDVARLAKVERDVERRA